MIAYWHHPPYTKASHNSDSETELVNIRTKFIQALEKRGVDMILCGHSHGYERGYVIKNFYTAWNTFVVGTHAISSSTGEYINGSTCPYVYSSFPANHGTMYVVAGSTGASGTTNTNFDAYGFPFSVNDGGVFYFEVEDNRLDAKMIRQNGTIFDKFTIIKDANKTTNYTVANGSSVKLTASWPQSGNYTWTPSIGTSNSVDVVPPSNATTNYTVTDAFGCITDQFSVTASNTLPVKLLSYDVVLANKKVNINWSTVTENNNQYFTVERSANGRDFTALKTVNSAGNSSQVQSYSCVDSFPLTGKSFYRLSQTDLDNRREYMGIKRIDFNPLTNFDVKVTGAQNNTLVLQIHSGSRGVYQLDIYDMLGRKWKSEVFEMGQGSIRKEISLNKGVYIWELRNEKGEKLSNKISIQ